MLFATPLRISNTQTTQRAATYVRVLRSKAPYGKRLTNRPFGKRVEPSENRSSRPQVSVKRCDVCRRTVTDNRSCRNLLLDQLAVSFAAIDLTPQRDPGGLNKNWCFTSTVSILRCHTASKATFRSPAHVPHEPDPLSRPRKLFDLLCTATSPSRFRQHALRQDFC